VRTVYVADNTIIRGFWSTMYDRFGNIIFPGQAVAEQTIVNVRHKSIERYARRQTEISYEFMLEPNDVETLINCEREKAYFSEKLHVFIEPFYREKTQQLKICLSFFHLA